MFILLQIDIREITKEAIELVMATETTMQGLIVIEKQKQKQKHRIIKNSDGYIKWNDFYSTHFSFFHSIPLFLDIHAYKCLYSWLFDCLFVCLPVYLFVYQSITHSLSGFISPHEISFILGTAMGDDPRTGRPVMVRSGRFGRYMQIGLDSEKNKTTHSLPQVIILTEIDLFWLIL